MHDLKFNTLFSVKCPFHTFVAGTMFAWAAMHLIGRQRKKSSESTVQDLIDRYKLQDHPEGGYYVETFRSDVEVRTGLGDGQLVSRKASTAIFFLICPGNVSRLHRIKSDEVWHFYLGGPMTVIELDINEEKGYRATVLGSDISKGELVQYTVKAGVWFGSFPNEGSEFSFVGCTVGIRSTFLFRLLVFICTLQICHYLFSRCLFTHTFSSPFKSHYICHFCIILSHHFFMRA